MAWLNIHDTYTHKQRPVIAYYHSNIYKAQENLKLTKDFLSHPLIAACYPEYLQIAVDTQKNLRFEEDPHSSLISRKESHFAAFSTESDPTGQHYTYIYNDDVTTYENTKTLQLNEINKLFYKKQVWLNDNLGRFKVFNTFTPYFEDSNTRDAELSNHPSIFYHKATIDDFPEIYNQKLIDDTLVGCNNDVAYFRSQTYMEYFPRTNQELSIPISVDTFVPSLPFNLEDAVIIQSSDPSYSKKNKTFYDKSSKASILFVAYYNEVYYIYDAWLSLGEEFEDWVEVNTQLAQRHNTDIFISDAQAYQQSLVNMIQRRLPNDTTVIPYKAKQSISKIQAANDVLSQLFKNGYVKILTPPPDSHLDIAVKQLKGEHPALDFVDCLTYAVSETKALKSDIEAYKRYNSKPSTTKNGSLLRRNKWRLI